MARRLEGQDAEGEYSRVGGECAVAIEQSATSAGNGSGGAAGHRPGVTWALPQV